MRMRGRGKCLARIIVLETWLFLYGNFTNGRSISNSLAWYYTKRRNVMDKWRAKQFFLPLASSSCHIQWPQERMTMYLSEHIYWLAYMSWDGIRKPLDQLRTKWDCSMEALTKSILGHLPCKDKSHWRRPWY